MESTKIIQTIKKVLELSKNNPSEEEARTAALMAQKLLAKYHIEMSEVEDINLDEIEEITEVCINVAPRKWKYELAKIIANNFRCRHFYYGKQKLVFFGHQTDAKVASETFKYLFKYGDKLAHRAEREAKEYCGYSDGVYNSFAVGFCEGIKEVLDNQCVALMLTVPEDVNESYKEKSKNFGSSTYRLNAITSSKAYNDGKTAGRDAVRQRQLAGG